MFDKKAHVEALLEAQKEIFRILEEQKDQRTKIKELTVEFLAIKYTDEQLLERNIFPLGLPGNFPFDILARTTKRSYKVEVKGKAPTPTMKKTAPNELFAYKKSGFKTNQFDLAVCVCFDKPIWGKGGCLRPL
jgi:hypothetical protein